MLARYIAPPLARLRDFALSRFAARNVGGWRVARGVARGWMVARDVSNNTNHKQVLIIFIHGFIDSSIHSPEYNSGHDNP